MKVLALGAHPDDIEIYMFGALAALGARGDSLAFAIATDGARGGSGDPVELSRTRRAEASAAAGLLGVVPSFLDFPDGGLIADGPLIGALKGLIEGEGPDLILVHAPNDYHGDHRALSEAARIAASFSAPVLHADTFRGVGFAPTHLIDVTAHFELKAQAISLHVSQDPGRFIEAARALNGFRASQANGGAGAYAEAYRFEPSYPFADIRDLLPPAPTVRPIASRSRPPG